MFELLRQTIRPLITFSAREQSLFENAFTFRQVPARFALLQAGQVAREFYFVNQGLIRLYYPKDGEEITGFIFQEGLFAGSYDSLLSHTPSVQALETLEPCDLLVINQTEMEELYHRLPKLHILTRKVVEQRFINAQRILSSFILDSPEQRYRKFEVQHPDLLQRVPQHIIASFLGVTPVSLSRIRKRIQAEEQ